MSHQTASAGSAGAAMEQAPPRRPLHAEPQERPLQVHVHECDGGVVVRLCGVAGMVEAEGVRKQLETLADEGAAVIVLDLTDLAFIGSAGLTAIVCAYLKGRRHQGEIRLAAPQPAVLGVLERTRLTALFPVYATVARAVIG